VNLILRLKVMSVRANLRERFEATKKLVDFSISKKVISDLKGRLGKDVRDPTMPREYGIPGKVGGVAGLALAIPVAVVDKVEEWWQEQARISRRWVK
jgi:hypothetical protein